MGDLTKIQIAIPADRSGQGSTFAPLNTVAPLAGTRLNNDGAAIFVVPVADAGGFMQVPLMYPTDSDQIAGTDQFRQYGVVNFMVGLYPLPNGSGLFNRLVTTSDNTDTETADTAQSGRLLRVGSRLTVWAGAAAATFRRVYAAGAANLAALTSFGAVMVAKAGDWAIQHQPAAATQATITRAAGGAGTRHVCTSITVSIAAVAAQGAITFNLRDGATGAGTILWSVTLIAAAGTGRDVTISDLHIVGSDNTAMTLESAAAPAATNFATVALTGHDAT